MNDAEFLEKMKDKASASRGTLITVLGRHLLRLQRLGIGIGSLQSVRSKSFYNVDAERFRCRVDAIYDEIVAKVTTRLKS